MGLVDGAVDLGLVLRGEAEGLGEAAVLGAVDLAAGHQSDEVVLDGLRVALAAEGRRRLAGAGEADDDDGLLARFCRHDLAAGVHRQTALVVDDLVPHPQAALFGLAEVVGVEDAGDAVFEVDGDATFVGVAGSREVGRVDDSNLRFAAGAVEVEVLLHAGDVGVGALDYESRGRLHCLRIRDVAVDDDHRLAGDVFVLEAGDLLVLRAGHRLVPAMGLRIVGHDIRRAGTARVDAGNDVHASAGRAPRVRHFER